MRTLADARNTAIATAALLALATPALCQVANPHYDAIFTQEFLWYLQQKVNPSAGELSVALGASASSGNEFFQPSEYGFDCSGPLPDGTATLIQPLQAGQSYAASSGLAGNHYADMYNGGGDDGFGYGSFLFFYAHNICKVTKMPEVDASFVDRLASGGYEYFVTYPLQDHQNGKGLLVWSKGGASNFGSAHLTGAGFVNQFAPYTRCTINPQDIRTCTDTVYAHTDFLGDVGSHLNGADPSNAARLVVHYTAWDWSWSWHVPTVWTNAPYDPTLANYWASVSAGIVQRGAAYRNYTAYGNYFDTLVVDPWFSTPSTPPTPPVPLQQASAPPSAPPANPTNLPGASVSADAGAPGDGTAGEGDGGAFDWNAYCQMPNSDGTPKPAAWVQNCLATGH